MGEPLTPPYQPVRRPQAWHGFAGGERDRRKKWMRAKCLPRALAAQAMLRRRGIPSKLCLGIAREGEALAAHAWLEFGRQIVTGGDVRPRYTRLVEFGGERA